MESVKIGSLISELRLMRHLTRDELSHQADIGSKYLYLIENGKTNVSTKILYNICKVLGITVREFYSLHEIKNKIDFKL